MTSFTAIDFETSQGYRHSICQVGIVRVENGVVSKTFETLVQPPGNYYWYNFIDVHGITPEMTEDVPTFDKVWHQIEPFIKGQHLVAHNMIFDASCLRGTLEYYGLKIPQFNEHCTCNLYGRKGLNKLCKEYNIELNHHEALSDAMACARLFLLHLGEAAVS